MQKTIWKHTLAEVGEQAIYMPASAEILSVEEQHGDLVLYAMVTPTAPTQPRTVAIVGTGNPAPGWCDKTNFVGTVKLMEGRLMFHIFAR